MKNRRDFLRASTGLVLGSCFLSYLPKSASKKDVGINLYSIREAMLSDAADTLKKLATIGYKEIESAKSVKGNYYGLKPKEIKNIIEDLGMTLRSGHAPVNTEWQKSIDEAAESGQDYLVSGLPLRGQTVDTYKRAADIFNKAAEDCKKSNIIFGYHNSGADFKSDTNKVLYDVLLENTDPNLVKMQLDIGWAIVGGGDPVKYIDTYPGRFPLWHLKDLNKEKPESIELGKGRVDIVGLLQMKKKSGMNYYFIEQEESEGLPIDSMKYNFDYLNKLK